jgi:hypothetical protein
MKPCAYVCIAIWALMATVWLAGVVEWVLK